MKPLDGFAGMDVWKVRADDSVVALLESATRRGARQVIAQEYMEDVTSGNKRLFVLDGDIIGAVHRLPSDRDFRIGAPAVATQADDADGHIVATLRPTLAQAGIRFAGLDVIGGRLIEVNVTCPGGTHKTDALTGSSLSHTIMARLLDPNAGPG